MKNIYIIIILISLIIVFSSVIYFKKNKEFFNNLNTNFNSAKKYITMKRKHNNESLSGPGSHIKNISETTKLINNVIKKYNITSILDLGCGD